MKFRKNSCLLLIDLQEDYNELYNDLSKSVTKLLKKARKENVLICFVFKKDLYVKPFLKELRGNKPLDEGNPFDFATPLKNEKTIIKRYYDSFFETKLNSFLTQNNIETLYISGCLTGVCVLNTMFGAFNRDYRIHLIENACSDHNKKRHHQVIEQYKNYLFIAETI